MSSARGAEYGDQTAPMVVARRSVISMNATTPTRHTRQELRNLLLETALVILREQGLGLGVKALTFKRVFERVEHDTGIRLTNASVIGRLWKNLADYQADVLAIVAAGEAGAERDATAGAIAPIFRQPATGTVEVRRARLREVCRIGGAVNSELLRDSREWSVWLGVWALATSGAVSEEKERILDALHLGYDRITDGYAALYSAIMDHLGLCLRPGLTLQQFTVGVSALAEGCALRSRVDESMVGILLPTGEDGAPQEWTIFAIGLDALTQEFFDFITPFPPAGT